MHMGSYRKINVIKHTQPIICLFANKAAITPKPFKGRSWQFYNTPHTLPVISSLIWPQVMKAIIESNRGSHTQNTI